MKFITYSHHFGDMALPDEIRYSVLNMIEQKKFKIEKNCASNLRSSILDSLRNLGWSSQTKIVYGKGLTITAMKEGVGLCLQTGNMGRFYADLLKLQSVYLKEKAWSAIYILPTKETATEMGDNLANYERLISELSIFKHIITIPILIIGLEKEDSL